MLTKKNFNINWKLEGLNLSEDWSSTFTAKVDKAWKIWVPKAVRDLLSLEKGDYVEVRIRIVQRSHVRRGEV